MNELYRQEEESRQPPYSAEESKRPAPPKSPLESLLEQVIRRRPYITALAVISPGGRLWASAMPSNVEAESVAAMAAPVALLGRRVALEQLGSDMRQAYVEGRGGYTILRTVGEEAVLLIIAAADANLALVLHDVDLLEDRVIQLMKLAPREVGKWTLAASSIEDLRRAASEEPPDLQEARLDALRTKLSSLDLGFFPERVNSIRAQLQDSPGETPQDLEAIEAELLALEQDVMNALEQEPPLPVSSAADRRRGDRPNFLRRALRWLASMIESED
jgi:predicted regulator of Ras-like GTPase activity (Roadblock/LC7/MglB family)